MTLLEEINAGESILVVVLRHHDRDIEAVDCETIEEARVLLDKKMAGGWHYYLPRWQFAYAINGDSLDPYREEVCEIERALGRTPAIELI